LTTCLSQGIFPAMNNIFEQSIYPYNFQNYFKLYFNNPESAIKHVEGNQKNIDYGPPLRKLRKGTKIGLYVLLYRSSLRLAIDYKYNVTAETLIRDKAEEILNYIIKGLSNVFNTFKNVSTPKAEKMELGGEVVVVATNSINFDSSLEWINFSRGKKLALKSLSGRLFYYFGEFSIWLLHDVFYRKYRGKDKDDLILTLQKMITRILCNLASSLAFMLVNFALFSFIKRENLPISLVRLLLEMILSTYLVEYTKITMTAICPRLKTNNSSLPTLPNTSDSNV